MRWKWTVQRKNEENFIETDQLQAGDRFLVTFYNGELHEAEVMDVDEDAQTADCRIQMPKVLCEALRTELLFPASILVRCIRQGDGEIFKMYSEGDGEGVEYGMSFTVRNERSKSWETKEHC